MSRVRKTTGVRLSVADVGGKAAVRAKKRVTPIAKKTKKKSAPRKKSLQSDRVTVKLVLQDNGVETRVPIVDKTKQNIQTLNPSVPQTQVLEKPTVLSPYRFPLIPETRALQLVTRVVALFFILFGTIATALHATPFISFEYAQPASTITATSDSSSTTTLNQQTTLDPKPDPRIVLDVTTDFLFGRVPVRITVPYANEVKLLAEDRANSRFLTMGTATKLDSSSWNFLWDTTQYVNGTYRIKLVIRNEFGTYEAGDSTDYEIRSTATTNSETTIVPTSTSSSSPVSATSSSPQTTEQSASSTQIKSEPSAIEVSVPAGTVSKTVSLRAFIAQATELKWYAQNISTLTRHYLGRAVAHDDEEWRFLWDTTKVPNGKYAVRAAAIVEGLNMESAAKSIVVENVTTIASTDSVNTATTTEAMLEPDIFISLSKQSPLVKTVEVLIETGGAQWVEVYARQKNGLTPYFLGLAQKQSNDRWKYLWDTTKNPNGDYELYVRVKSPYGFTEGKRLVVRVLNEVTPQLTAEQEAEIDTFSTLDALLTKEVDGLSPVSDIADTSASYTPPKMVYIEPVSTFVERTSIADDKIREELDASLSAFRDQLRQLVSDFSKALRSGEEVSARRFEDEALSLKGAVLQALPQSSEYDALRSETETYLSQIIFESFELARNNERILKERAGELVTLDTDKDGISNYDEVHLYKTNPYVADTDGDGFIDGAEITQGYNPHDSSSESLILYESPVEAGETREDILTVHTISTITLDDDKIAESGKPAVQALISGKGLPNSFVTLYIYSTPVIVTVRTDDDGNWTYIFDKELEEGEHTLYVGITDNAGRIVAKSEPVSFVKTAEAYTETSGIGVVTTESGEPSMFGSKGVFLLGSLLVLILGLVLVIIGMHIDQKAKSEGTPALS